MSDVIRGMDSNMFHYNWLNPFCGPCYKRTVYLGALETPLCVGKRACAYGGVGQIDRVGPCLNGPHLHLHLDVDPSICSHRGKLRGIAPVRNFLLCFAYIHILVIGVRECLGSFDPVRFYCAEQAYGLDPPPKH